MASDSARLKIPPPPITGSPWRVQLSAGFEHPVDFPKAGDGMLHTTENQRRHNGIEGASGKGQMLDVGGSQADVRVQSGLGLRDGGLIKFSRHHMRLSWIMIKIWPPTRAHLQHPTAHIA